MRNGHPVPITVTPILVVGENVACAIEGADCDSSVVQGGIIKLKHGKSYELQFKLEENRFGLKFWRDEHKAFWCCHKHCPTAASSEPWLHPKVTDQGSLLTVHATPPKDEPGFVFYRLNFDPAGSFDPIIIHD